MEIPEPEFGRILDRRQMELAPNVTYNWYNMEIERGLQKIHYVEFDPKNPNLELQAGTKSGHVYGMQKVTDMARYADGTGNRIIAGINGDFYDLSGQGTGVPNGLFMGEGVILNSSAGPYAFGLKEDGTSLYGPTPQLTRTVTIGDQTVNITHINRYRQNNQLVLYTTDYYTSTKSTDLGDEIIVDVVEGEVRSGQTMKMIVKEIRKNSGDSPLEEGTAVLSVSGTMRNLFDGVHIGDELSARFELEEAWRDVKIAIGGQGPLVLDGEPKDVPPAGVHPRTAIGTKADGSIILFEIDGRAPGFSEGVQNIEMAQMLRDLGVVNAMNLDGGGSSTFVARLPGESAIQMLNRGSDGFERSTGNSLLLVNKAPESDAAKLVVQPVFERVLAGASFPLKTAAVDTAGHPATFSGNPVWTVDEALGTIDANGLFTASDRAGSGVVTVQAGGLNGAGEIEVVDQLSRLELPDAVKAFAPGATERLTVTAYRDGQVIQADNGSFEWRVEESVGTIDEDGVFTAADDNNQSGKIYVKYGEVETSMEVHVGVPPVLLEDFESGLDNYIASSAAANSVAISEETNPDFVRFGGKSVKLEYDFIGRTGTSGAYLAAKDRSEIPGYPEKISMWVYGDGNGQWLRGQLKDGSGANVHLDFTDQAKGVDWVGWKYVEAVVPAGKPVPLSMDMPVRYMGINNNNKTAGVLYIDQIRAIYGPLEDEDREPPVLRTLFPADGEIVRTGTPAIRAIAEDDRYDPVQHPGTTLIDPDSIRMYLDNERVAHTLYPPEGRISYTPPAPLDEGVHRVKLAVRDLAGNQIIKEWNFFVNLGSPLYEYDTPEEVYAGQSYTVDIRAGNPEQFEGGHIEFGFDSSKAGQLQVIKGGKLADGQLQAIVNEQEGTVRIEFSGLVSANLTDGDVLAQIRYTVNPEAEGNLPIAFRSGSIQVTDGEPKPFSGLPLSTAIHHYLQVSWNKEDAGQGLVTVFKVKDEDGQPAEGAALLMDGNEVGDGSEAYQTNADGVLQTDALTAEAGNFQLQAVKDNHYSPVMTFKVSPLAGSETPYNISAVMSDDPASSRGFTWHTHPDTVGTVVEVVKQSEFGGFEQGSVLQFTGDSYLYYTEDFGIIRVHKAAATGLEPDTDYVYRVGSGDGLYSEQGSFRTAPLSGDTTKFLFFGDSQADNKAGFDLWGHTLDTAMDAMPDAEFIVHAGDMVDHGHAEKQWNLWFEAAQEQLMNTTLVTVVGNHEVTGTRKNDDFLAHFNFPETGLDGLKGTQFSFDYKNIHFVVLNSEYDYEEQAEWLRNDLAATDKRWKVAVFHRGPYGSYYDEQKVKDAWAPVFDEFAVDLVLNGHDHSYTRSFPMKGKKAVPPGEGTVYVVGGSTGPKFYPSTPKDHQEVIFDERTQIFTAIEVNGEQLTLVVQTVDGREVDRFTLSKANVIQPEAVELKPDKAELQPGEQLQLTAEVKPDNATDKDITWSISDSSEDGVAEVDENGLVTANKPGNVTVRAASARDGVYAESRITVTERQTPREMEAIELQGRVQLVPGDSDQTVTEAVYSDRSRISLVSGVRYESSDPQIATIDDNGLVKALAEGDTVISASYEGFRDSYRLTVNTGEPVLSHIELTGPRELKAGESGTAVTMAVYSDGRSIKLTEGVLFESSNEAVAAVDNQGTVHALKEGTAKITAHYAGLQAGYSLSVVRGNDPDPDPEPEPELVRLEISGLRSVMETGDTSAAQVTARYSDNTSHPLKDGVSFTSKRPEVASVNRDGVVRALRYGTTEITAAYGGLTASFSIRVYDEDTGANPGTPPLQPPVQPPAEGSGKEENGILELTEEQFKKLIRDDGALIEVSELFTELVLPGNAGEWLDGQPLLIRSIGWEVSLPASELEKLAAKAEEEDRGESKISFTVSRLTETESNNLLHQAEQRSDANLSAVGELYQFRLTLITKEGIRVEWNQFGEPVTLSFPVPLNSRWLAGIYYIADEGDLDYVDGEWKQGRITGQIHHFSAYGVLNFDMRYGDVEPGYWAEAVIKELSAMQLLEGTGPRQFEPLRPVTRAEFSAMLVRILSLSGDAPSIFTDVDSREWYAEEVALAAQAGIVNGVGEHLFAPDAYIKRQEMTAMIVRAYEYVYREASVDGGEVPFSDIEGAPDWAQAAVRSAYHLGLVTGRSDDRFEPQGEANRAESAKIMHSLLSKISK